MGGMINMEGGGAEAPPSQRTKYIRDRRIRQAQ